ncbi:universal stress protein, partial [Georgenia thermotolerans]
VAAAARRAGVAAETVSQTGEPAPVVLAEADRWAADLLVTGRADPRAASRAYVGTVTRELLEFAEVPVLVVPQPVEE